MWVITWLSAALWHSYKYRSQKSDIWQTLLLLALIQVTHAAYISVVHFLVSLGNRLYKRNILILGQSVTQTGVSQILVNQDLTEFSDFDHPAS